MKPVIRIAFADTFDNAENFWIWMLDKRYQICIDPHNPQLLIFGDGNFGQEHRQEKWKKTPKLFFTGENVRAPFPECTWSCDFDFDRNVPPIFVNHHYRLPLYVLETWSYHNDHGYPLDYLQQKETFPRSYFEHELALKRGFCSFVQANPNVPFRNDFFQWLNNLKPVASGGPHLNNVGYVVNRPGGHIDKHEFIRKYKFNIAFENGAHDGYVTEKLLNAFYANTIPIYWGSSTVFLDFNSDAYIDVRDYIYNNQLNTDALWDKIKKIDQDDDLYVDMLSTSAYHGANTYQNVHNCLDWFERTIYKELK